MQNILRDLPEHHLQYAEYDEHNLKTFFTMTVGYTYSDHKEC
jgi:hypothetical protein